MIYCNSLACCEKEESNTDKKGKKKKKKKLWRKNYETGSLGEAFKKPFRVLQLLCKSCMLGKRKSSSQLGWERAMHEQASLKASLMARNGEKDRGAPLAHSY